MDKKIGNRYSPGIINKIRSMMESGYTTKEVADEIGIERRKVYGIATRNGIKMTEEAAKRQKEYDLKKKSQTYKEHNWYRQREQMRKNDPLCVYCENTNMYKCRLFDPDVAIPPEGSKYLIRNENYYFVQECKNFKREKRNKK